MRVLKSDEGVGFPLRMDDMRYMTQGLTEALAATTAALGQLPSEEHGVLLRGSFSVSGSVAQISDAWIYYKGEVFHTPAQAVAALNPHYPGWFFEIESIIEASRNFKDGTFRPVHINRKLSLGTFNALLEPPDGALRSTRLVAVDEIFVLKSVTGWTNASLGSGSVTLVGNTVSYRRNSLGNLEVRGMFSTSSSANSTLFTLPLGFRPIRAQRITLFGTTDIYGLAEQPMNVTFNTSGDVVLSNYSGISQGLYAFNHTIFL